MNSTKKNIQKTSGTRKRYKPGQLITICKDVFRIVKKQILFYRLLHVQYRFTSTKWMM